MIVPPLTRDQVRQVDQIAIEHYGMDGIVLMENAGRGAAEMIDRVAPEGQIIILCGAGNNGGDGYVIARHLQLFGRRAGIVSVVEIPRLVGDAKTNAEIAIKAGIEIQEANQRSQITNALTVASTIVDCLLGTGAKGPLRGIYAAAVTAANNSDAVKIAIDIPTGLDCDSGEAGDPTFRASHTMTFVARKVGFDKHNADEFVGVVHEVGIGVPLKLLRDLCGSFPSSDS